MKTTSKAVKALEEKGIKFDTPRLELAKKDENGVPRSTGKHVCTILRDEKRTDIREYTGGSSYKEVTGIRYWFDEGGVEKYYDVALFSRGTADKPNYLISKFAELEEGDKVSLQYVEKGGKGYIEVQKVGASNSEMPVINLDEDNDSDAPGLDGDKDISPEDVPF